MLPDIDLNPENLGAVGAVVIALYVLNHTLTAVDIAWDALARRSRDWRDTLANGALMIMREVVERTPVALLGVVALFLVEKQIPWTTTPTPLSWVSSIVCADLTYYWMHRLEHRVRILWCHHAVHHSSQSYNFTVAGRLSILEPLVEWVFIIPMLLLGFDATQTLFSVLVVAMYQHWLHTAKIGPIPFLEGWLNTPAAHRVHHAANPRYWDKNFGGILMVWDRLWGTFAQESSQDPVIYGVVPQVKSYNPIGITLVEYRRLVQDLIDGRTWRQRLAAVWGPPGSSSPSPKGPRL